MYNLLKLDDDQIGLVITLSSAIILTGVGLGGKIYDNYKDSQKHIQVVMCEDNTATIIDAKKIISGKEAYYVKTNYGNIIIPYNSSRIVELDNPKFTAEDIAIYAMGEDVEIIYADLNDMNLEDKVPENPTTCYTLTYKQ